MLVLLLKTSLTPQLTNFLAGRRVAREMFEQKNNCVLVARVKEMNMFLRTDQPQCGFKNSKQHSNVHLHKPP